MNIIRAIAIAVLIFVPLRTHAASLSNTNTRVILFFLVYGLGFLLTILLLFVIARRSKSEEDVKKLQE